MSNEATALDLQRGPYQTTFVGLNLQRESTPDEWEAFGEVLRRVDEAKQWAIGDWLVDGKKHYGDKLYDKASPIVGYTPQALNDFKSIAERIQISWRHEVSFQHHKEVASLKTTKELPDGKLRLSDETDYEKIDEVLSWAEKEKASVRALRERVSEYKRRQQEEIRLANEPEKYSVILADPAWEYDFSRSDSRNIDNQYEPSSIEDMSRLRIPAADNCVMFMWATSPKLREAFKLIDAWGFEYKTCAIWEKDKIGMGYYFRQRHELLLVATRGQVELPDPSKRPDSIIASPREEHSVKPELAYELIEQMYPGYKRLEMFARKGREGWDSWGDES